MTPSGKGADEAQGKPSKASHLLAPGLPAPFETVLPASLLLVLMPSGGPLHPVALAIAAGGLLLPRARVSPWLWFGIAAARGADHLASGWYLVDNHHFLLSYWTVALGLCLLAAEPAETLRTNARLLLGLCFAFAGTWKLLSGEYTNGAFMSFVLLVDPGPTGGLPWLDVPADSIRFNREAISALRESLLANDPVPLAGFTDSVRRWSLAMGWWTILIEWFIAVAFLLPARSGKRRAGHVGVIGFAATTYLMAPVLVFGLLLLLMGFAQIEPARRSWRMAYLATFVILIPTVFGILGDLKIGVFFAGAVLLYGYLIAWGRWMLLGGLAAVAIGLEGASGLVGHTLGGAALAVGLAAIVVCAADAVSRRGTERWLVACGIAGLAVGLVTGGLTRPALALVAILGLVVLALAVSIGRRTRPSGSGGSGPQRNG